MSEPFGDADVDTETKRLRGQYQAVYFEDTTFSAQALTSETFVISGRRGTGKTALSRYFSFQKQMPGIVHIEVRERETYPEVLAALADLLTKGVTTAIPELVKVWSAAVAVVIIDHIHDKIATRSSLPPGVTEEEQTPTGRLTRALNWAYSHLKDEPLFEHQQPSQPLPRDTLDELRSGIEKAKQYATATQQQIILTIDTLEKYDIADKALMAAVAALVQFASDFNLTHAPELQVKVFLPGEVYSHLEEVVLLAPSKHLRRPLHLIWTPSDLLRMLMWRYWKHLFISLPGVRHKAPNVHWKDARDIHTKMWKAYFTKNISAPATESSFIYVLRHTQMRPRQLIQVCNEIAASQNSTSVDRFDQRSIATGVKAVQGRLVSDVLNSVVLTHPNVRQIVDAIAGAPPVLDEHDLTHFGELTAAYWPNDSYSSDRFRELLVELGAIGRIVKRSGKSPERIDAEFDYSASDRLVIGRNESCVIHPMFYRRLNIDAATAPRVMPFGPHLEQLEEIVD